MYLEIYLQLKIIFGVISIFKIKTYRIFYNNCPWSNNAHPYDLKINHVLYITYTIRLEFVD